MNDTKTAIVIKSLDATRVAIISEEADGFDTEFGPIFGRLYPSLFGTLGRHGVAPAGPSYGLYDQRDDGRIDVIAGVTIASDANISADGVTTRDLPAAERAATLIHHGSMATITNSYALLERWITTANEQPLGSSREVYLHCPEDQDEWVTELQFVLA